MDEDYYTILGVHRKVSPEAIHEAYRELARQYHPDLNPHEAAGQEFQRIQEAFEVLSDRKRRAAYNRTAISFKTARKTGPQSAVAGAG